jgi:hypothetical protein
MSRSRQSLARTHPVPVQEDQISKQPGKNGSHSQKKNGTANDGKSPLDPNGARHPGVVQSARMGSESYRKPKVIENQEN